jgi:Icc-related predicted phosphoesterase
MKIQILSDLHLETGTIDIPAVKADAIIMAGDIVSGRIMPRKCVDWLKKQFGDIRPIVYVTGNHEFYHRSIEGLRAELKRETEGTNIHVLENSLMKLGGWRVLGCTAWTDFLGSEQAMKNAEKLMNDFRLIERGSTLLRPDDMVEMHRESVAWLTRELTAGDRTHTIVVTHHAPSGKSEAAVYRHSPLKGAFHSNLDDLINRFQPVLWVHGHTHHNVDYHIGETRVIANQRGYAEQQCEDFRPDLVVDLPDAPAILSTDEV